MQRPYKVTIVGWTRAWGDPPNGDLLESGTISEHEARLRAQALADERQCTVQLHGFGVPELIFSKKGHRPPFSATMLCEECGLESAKYAAAAIGRIIGTSTRKDLPPGCPPPDWLADLAWRGLPHDVAEAYAQAAASAWASAGQAEPD